MARPLRGLAPVPRQFLMAHISNILLIFYCLSFLKHLGIIPITGTYLTNSAFLSLGLNPPASQSLGHLIHCITINETQFSGIQSLEFYLSTSASQSPGLNSLAFQSPELNSPAFQSPGLNSLAFQSPELNSPAFQLLGLKLFGIPITGTCLTNSSSFLSPGLNPQASQSLGFNYMPFQ
ncbi:hypothetical protein niasHS_001216 [Heterodera schachtii]|uniref:Uncharacterized protein n=1 Tax=Heterodera schachtii TaxID=97005 RepID=A0ABD2KIK7_HETSC